MWLCYGGNFNSLNPLPFNRTYGAGRTHAGLCPKFLVLHILWLQMSFKGHAKFDASTLMTNNAKWHSYYFVALAPCMYSKKNKKTPNPQFWVTRLHLTHFNFGPHSFSCEVAYRSIQAHSHKSPVWQMTEQPAMVYIDSIVGSTLVLERSLTVTIHCVPKSTTWNSIDNFVNT